MNYADLKTRLSMTCHRVFKDTEYFSFTADATERINRRLNLQLVTPVADADTNEVLTAYPLLYVYAALIAAYEHLNNGDNATYYEQAWQEECAGQNITQAASTDPYATEPPVMKGA